jgi:hypothetical protein
MNANLQGTIGTAIAATTTANQSPPAPRPVTAESFAEDVVAALRQNLRAARERMERIGAYCKTGRGGGLLRGRACAGMQPVASSGRLLHCPKSCR